MPPSQRHRFRDVDRAAQGDPHRREGGRQSSDSDENTVLLTAQSSGTDGSGRIARRRALCPCGTGSQRSTSRIGSTDAVAANLLSQQRADGRWALGGVARPPVEDGDVTRTFLAMSTMKIYAPPGRAQELAERMGRATKWITSVKAATAEDRNTQLLALDCAAVDKAVIQRFAKAILALQRPDGGWAQRPGLTSDAYATGQTLVRVGQDGQRGAVKRRVPERCEVSALDAARRWIVVREESLAEIPAVLRKRVSVRPRSVDFGDGDRLGDDSAGDGASASRSVVLAGSWSLVAGSWSLRLSSRSPQASRAPKAARYRSWGWGPTTN